MFRPFPARDVSTCLRCHLRLLRQVRPRKSQRRHQSSAQDPPLIRYTHDSGQPSNESHGRIRGRKGQRRIESAEPLSIKSLGQSSEVIVLRDLPKQPKKIIIRTVQEDGDTNKEPREPSRHEAEAVASTLTAKDIENFSTKKAPRALPSEVFEAIESIKPDYSGFVLSKTEFDAKATALIKGFDIGQLRGYLYAASKSTTARPSRSSSKSAVEVTEVSVAKDDLKALRRTAWHPGTTRVDVRLPLERSVERQIQIGRKMNKKQFVVEAILREAWGVMIEEEEATIGEMDFLLTPLQFGLLLTKNSNTLRPLLESSKFYQNSRFQLYQPHRVIRIIGPRAEAEAIASVLGDSFAPTRSAEIDLDNFGSLTEKDGAVNLENVFNPRQLSDIMELTRTYIEYNAESKKLSIASFVGVAINDAHRLLISLLPLPARHETRTLYDGLDDEEFCLETVPATRILPFKSKYQDLSRWVTSSPRTNGRFKAKFGGSTDASDPERTKRRPLLDLDRPIFRKALETMQADRPVDEADRPAEKSSKSTPKSYWHAGAKVTSWKARVGCLLHDGVNDTYPGDTSDQTLKDTSRPKAVFSPRTPHLFGLISASQHIPVPITPVVPLSKRSKEVRDRRKETSVELIAHLIPSPLEDAGTLAATAFPHIELGFEIENQLFKGTRSVFHPSDASAPRPSRVGPATQARFKGLRAILDLDVVELNLPSQPVDLRFERRHTLVSLYAQLDPNISAFATAIQNSMLEDSSLRAPPALQLRIPKWATRAAPASAAALGLAKHRGAEVPVKYLFAGFEHRERRNLKTEAARDHVLRLETVEAGVTGGRRVEVSLVDDRNGDPRGNAEEILRDAVGLVNHLTKIQRGEVKKYFSRDLAKDLYLRDKERDEKAQAGVADVVLEEGEREERDEGEWGEERHAEYEASSLEPREEQREAESERDPGKEAGEAHGQGEPELRHGEQPGTAEGKPEGA